MSGLLIFLFLCIFGAILIAVAIGINVMEAQRQRQVKSLLTTLSAAPEQEQAPIILQDVGDRDSTLRALMTRLNLAEYLDARLSQSGLNWSMGHLLGLMVAFGVAGFLVGYLLNLLLLPWLSGVFFTGLGVLAPHLFLLYKRKQRLGQFEQQFPDALDFIARAMRAGHAFSVGLEMLGTETPDPLGREFRTLFNEQNLGAPLDTALGNMVRRVPLLDMRFFVSIVRLQRQTGGNLAEILTRLAYIIRERFRLKGQVRAASAHGRLTASVLTALPIITVLLLRIVAPGYVQSMVDDPDGKYLLIGAVLAQLVGFYIMKRIISIKV